MYVYPALHSFTHPSYWGNKPEFKSWLYYWLILGLLATLLTLFGLLTCEMGLLRERHGTDHVTCLYRKCSRNISLVCRCTHREQLRLEMFSVQGGGHTCSYPKSPRRASLRTAELQVSVNSWGEVSVVKEVWPGAGGGGPGALFHILKNDGLKFRVSNLHIRLKWKACFNKPLRCI